MSQIDEQVHHRFKVFAGALDEGGGLEALAAQVKEWAADGGVAPKSIGVEYVEAVRKLLLSVGYRDDEPGYPVRLDSVSLGALGPLDAGTLANVETAMADASRQFDRVICHELYVTGGQELRMVFMIQEG